MSRPTKRIFSGRVTGEGDDHPLVDRPSGTEATGSAPDSLSVPERRPGTMVGVGRAKPAGPPRPSRDAAVSPAAPNVGPRCKPGAPDALEPAEQDVGVTQLLEGGAGIDGTQLIDESTGDDPIVVHDSQKLLREEVPALVVEDADEVSSGIPEAADTRPQGGHAPALPSPDDTFAYNTALRCPSCHTTFSGEVLFCPFDGKPLEEAMDWDPSGDPLLDHTVAERYVVEAVIAEGGMGTVYRVRHAKLGNAFAMKVLRRDLAEDEQVAARLIEEARATAAIGHANIVSVSDFGEIEGEILPELGELKLPYFVMEYVAGGSLSDVIRRDGKLVGERVAKIVVQLASALSAAHNSGIIHRDLKPENVLLTSDESGNEIAKILDFGVAKVIGSSKKTQVGMVFGTPHYMSPEQGQAKKVDQRTDIYAVGVIMYECLMGHVPYSADTYVGVVTKHIHEPAPEIDDTLLKDMPLGPIVARCMEKDPDARYQAMSDLAHDLEKLLAHKLATRRSRTSMVLPDSSGALAASGDTITLPERKLVWVWAAAAAIGVAFLLVLALGNRHAPGAADQPSSTSGSVSPPTETGSATLPAATLPSASAEALSNASAETQEPPPPSAEPSSPPPTPPPSLQRPPPPPRPARPRGPSGEVVDPWG